jgi:hypothetical protein
MHLHPAGILVRHHRRRDLLDEVTRVENLRRLRARHEHALVAQVRDRPPRLRRERIHQHAAVRHRERHHGSRGRIEIRAGTIPRHPERRRPAPVAHRATSQTRGQKTDSNRQNTTQTNTTHAIPFTAITTTTQIA